MGLRLPIKNNKKLEQLLANIDADAELNQLWRSANINAVDRFGISDHGEVHIRIVANAALRLLRLLIDGGVEPSVVTNHGMTSDDAEVVVALAAALHDIGISIHRDDHERYSLIMAYPKSRQLLTGIYEEPHLTIMVAEVLHAIIAHNSEQRCLTIEAGAVKLADSLDMTEGRSRIPFDAGQINIHSISALAVKAVQIKKGEVKPVCIDVELHNSAGIFQIDNLLKKKLKNSTLVPYVEVCARIDGETEKRLMNEYRL
jgi:hypothetical protein